VVPSCRGSSRASCRRRDRRLRSNWRRPDVFTRNTPLLCLSSAAAIHHDSGGRLGRAGLERLRFARVAQTLHPLSCEYACRNCMGILAPAVVLCSGIISVWYPGISKIPTAWGTLHTSAPIAAASLLIAGLLLVFARDRFFGDRIPSDYVVDDL
jgi:hypothetical protein